MKKIAFLLSALALSFGSMAESLVTTAELDKLAAQNYQATLSGWQRLDAQTIEQKLKAHPQTKQVWLRKLLIEQLAQQKSLSAMQRQWLISQATSVHVLKAKLEDAGHETPINVINIPAQAKGVLAQFVAKEMAKTWHSLVEQGRFDWHVLQEQLRTVPRKNLTLTLFISSMSPGKLSDEVEKLLANSNVSPSNLVLITLAEHTNDTYQQYRLYQRVWSNTADEYSIRAVQNIIKGPNAQDNINQLKQAADNKVLTSLAFNLLAKHYGLETSVVNFLYGQLATPKRDSLAAVALSNIDSPQVKSRLQQSLHSPIKRVAKASRLALSLSQSKE